MRIPRIKRLAAGCLVLVGLVSIPASPASASSGKCSASQNACEWVENSSIDRRYIRYVDVYDPHTSAVHTLRLLENGYVIYTYTGPAYPGVEFPLNESLPSGTCLQGGVVGLDDARTPCWYVP